MNAQKRNGFMVAAVGLVLALFLAPMLGFAASLTAVGAGLFVVGDTTSTTDLNNAMKVIFEDSIINNVVADSELLDLFESAGGIKTEETTGGRYIETAQLFALPAGVGSRGENGYIPVPRGPVVQNSKIYLKKVIGSVEMTGDVLKRVRTDIGAFINWGEQAMPKLVERVTNEYDRMLLGFGSGVKAQVGAIDADNKIITLKNAMGVAGLGGATFQFLENESIRAATTAAGTTLRAGAMIVDDVYHATEQIKVSDIATNLTADDYLAEGDAADNSFGKDAMGLLGIVDDGGILATFQSINRANYTAWRGHVIDAQEVFGSGQRLTEEVVVYADDVAYTRGGAKVDVIVTSRDGLRDLWKDLKGDRSFNDPRSYTGGKGGIFIILGDRVVPIRVARKMPPSLCFGLTRKHLKKWLLNKFEWDDTTGSLFRQVTDSTGRRDAFYAYGTSQLEVGSDDPRKHFRIENFVTGAAAT